MFISQIWQCRCWLHWWQRQYPGPKLQTFMQTLLRTLFSTSTKSRRRIRFFLRKLTPDNLARTSRFVNLRGWPAVIYSDPGSQWVGASNELRDAWQAIENDQLIKQGAQYGTRWVFGPADSPWHQGAREALVKTVKKCLRFSIHSQRLTPAEYLSVAYETANMVNERPIGFRPTPDSPINILTPNSLLLGRSAASCPSSSCLLVEVWRPAYK